MPGFWQPGYLPAMTVARKTFIGSTTNAGVAIPAYNATAQVFGIWNPAGSGIIIIPVRLTVAAATTGSTAVAALGLSALYNTGSQVATGSPITAFTQTSSLPGMIGDAAGAAGMSQAKFTLSATMTAPTFVYDLGMATTAGTATTTAAPPALNWGVFDFTGAIGIAPGTYVGLGGSVAPGSTFQGSIEWMEIPA
jgi:hypothetical protein